MSCKRIAEKCAAGSCVLDESNGSHSCLCPYGRIGRLCEHIDRDAHQKPLNAIRFNGESSFLSLPPPSTLRNYTLELLVSPRTTQDQLLAYVASDYDPKHSNFMGLVMENGKFVYVYNNGDGDFEIEDAEQVKEGNAYRVELKRIGPKGEFGINHRKVASRRQQPSFQVGTDLFVGGLPPGVAPHRRLEQYSSLNGCIYKIIINGEEQDLKRFATVSSGGLSECEEELPPISTTTTTTTTTTPLPVVTSTVAVMPEIEITPAALFT
ncbi:unnamed protein product, partial [Anisakis simplex]|uniref:EGF-like domain-containing protein n=1 Tax=Anisakis simplex TaxID=6269 RepID=A0A0M3J340_ANISI